MFKYFLNFIDLPQIGLVEIQEPFGFDGSTHEIKQETNKHARNVIIANADIKLEFTRENFFQYDYLDAELERKGWELNIEFILQKDNLTFTTGIIDGLTAQRFRDSIEFNIIQNTVFEFIKKNESIEINAFSDKDLKGGTIAPCQTHNIFLKAKPIFQQSKWGVKNLTDIFINGPFPSNLFETFIIPIVNNLEKYEINFSNAPYDISVNAGDLDWTILHPNRLFTNKSTLKDLVLKIKNININFQRFNGGGNAYLKLVIYKYFLNSDGVTVSNFEEVVLSNNFVQTQGLVINNLNYTENIQDVANGYSYGAYLILKVESPSYWNLQYSCEGVEITATSTAFNSIVKGVRLHDLLEHQAKSMGTNLIDNVFLTDEYKDNFVMNGRMLANLNDLPFNNDFKNTFDSVCIESGSDFQITNAGIEILPFQDFYKDVEIAEFTELTDSNGEVTINNELSINAIEIGFKKSSFEKSGNKENTDDDIHTKLQAKFESNKADATYKREISHIRSAYIIEEQRIKGNEVEEKTKTQENDENLFLLDCIPLPAGTTNTITAFLQFRITTPNTLEILSNGTFNWLNQGLIVNQNINVYNNIFASELYKILNIENFKLTLQFLNNFPSGNSTGEATFNIVYSLQGVAYTNRTSEGFTTITGVRNGDNYSNLKFSLKRVLQKYNKWWGSAGQYLSNKKINVTEIKVNNKLETRLINETSNVIDFAPIELTNDFINERLLNGNVHKLKVFASFEKATKLFTDVKEIKGFVKINTLNKQIIKGFIKDASYRWRTEELVLTLLEMKDNKIINLTLIKDNIKNFNVIDGFVYIYDFDNKLMFKPKLHIFYSIGGVFYESLNDFENNFINLIN